MKPVLAWIKANLVTVICCVVVLASLPTAWVFASKWNKSIRETQQSKADSELRKVQAAQVEYTLPTYEPGQQAVSLRAIPNPRLTEWFAQQRERLSSEATQVVSRATDFNRGVGAEAQALGRSEFKPLVNGLFPTTLRGDELTDAIDQLTDSLLAKRGKPDPYAALVAPLNAGGPVDPVRLVEVLQDLRTRETQRITTVPRELTADEKASLQRTLIDRRIAEAQSLGRTLSVYATPEIFPTNSREFSMRPTEGLLSALPARDQAKLVSFFVWQWDLWVYQDVLAAVRLANTGPDGRLTSVDRSVVKRIVSLSVRDPEGLFGDPEPEQDPMMMAGGDPMAGAGGTPGSVPLDFQRSVTGRANSPSNQKYDVRRAQLVVIASSARIEELVRAISRTNFMTVTELDLAEVNVWDELRDGYFYGGEHVVRATLEIETVWLRSWMAPLMPELVRANLGVPDPAPATDESGQQPG